MDINRRRIVSWALAWALAPPVVAPGPVRAAEAFDARTLAAANAMVALREGGYVVVMAHGPVESDEDDSPAAPTGSCAGQRSLTDTGRLMASGIGKLLAREHVRVGAVVSSRYCRGLETADRIAERTHPAYVRSLDELNDVTAASTSADRVRSVDALKRLAGTVPAGGTNTIVVTHRSNMTAAFGGALAQVEDGALAVFKPTSVDGVGPYRLACQLTVKDLSRYAKAMSGSTAAGRAAAQPPPDFSDRLRSVGRVIDAAGAAALYAPMQKLEPYAGVNVLRDVSYGPFEANRLDLFVHERSSGPPKPVLVFVHGGGFVRGDKHLPGSPFYDNVMLWAVGHGLIGVNLNFRMPPQSPWPAASEDLGLAVQWVHRHIASHGGDASRVFLVGHSSGGALVASYVADSRFHGPAGVGLAGAVFLSTNIFDTTTAEASAPLTAYYGDDVNRHAERDPRCRVCCGPSCH